MKTLTSLYYLVPIFLCGFWISDTLGLLLVWINNGSPRLRDVEARSVSLSDIGAAHKIHFIIFSTLTAAFFVATIFIERHLRQVHGNLLKRQVYFDMLMTYSASIGMSALIALSIFDSFYFANAHWSLAIVFVSGVTITLFLQTVEAWHLSRHGKANSGHLYSLAIIKTILLCAAVALIAIYVGLYITCDGLSTSGKKNCEIITSVAADVEWALSAVLALYFLTFPWDFYCARQFEASKKAKKKLRYSTYSFAPPSIEEKEQVRASYLKAKDVPSITNGLEVDRCRSRT